MNRWFWYIGWLFAWFVAFALIVVPLSNLLQTAGAGSGMARGVILASAWVVLFAGMVFIHRRLRTHGRADSDGVHDAQAVGGAGMSEREAQMVAMARDEALGRIRSDPGDASPRTPAEAAMATASEPPASPGSPAAGVRAAPPGRVTKSAGNPLMRKAFAQAMKEVDTGRCQPGLWAMALVECNGDEKSARIAYMRARAADIAWAHARDAESAPTAAPRLDAGRNRRH